MDRLTYKTLRQQLKFDFSYVQFNNQIMIDFLTLSTLTGLFLTPFSFLNIFLIPLFMFRQFSILHEAVHGLSHTNKKINSFIGIIAGAFCITPYNVWKAAHLKHHYWTGNLVQDPTFAILKSYNESSSLKKNLIKTNWTMGIPLLGALQHFSFWTIAIKNLSSAEAIMSVLIPAVVFVIISQLGLFNLSIVVIGILIYFRIYEEMIVPQHVGLYSDDQPERHPPAWEQPSITRTWYLNPFLEKYVVLNMNYHIEHHLFPDLPWHQLDQAHMYLKNSEKILNIISVTDWMTSQRKREFKDVITPSKVNLENFSLSNQEL